MNSDRAHARHSDPSTSHQAADFATLGIKKARDLVERFAWKQGPDGFVDAQLSDELGDTGSTLRTRRSELTAANVILDSGRKGKFGDSERLRIVWVHRDFVPNAPPTVETDQAINDAGTFTPPGQPPRLKQGALAMAAEFDGFARSLRAEGRAHLAERCAAVAALLRSLAR